MKKYLIVFFGVLFLFLTGCQAFDVVARVAVTSFADMSGELPPDFDQAIKSWKFRSPGGEVFVFSTDFTSISPDFSIQLAAKPFIDSGLIPSKLPPNYHYDKAADILLIDFEIGSQKFAGSVKLSKENFKGFISSYRGSIGYHGEFDHYGIALGNGNMFEWAKDLKTNDKDIVFVLNPAPFIKAGVDSSKIQEWKSGQVTIKDENGNNIKVDKFLKPYNLK